MPIEKGIIYRAMSVVPIQETVISNGMYTSGRDLLSNPFFPKHLYGSKKKKKKAKKWSDLQFYSGDRFKYNKLILCWFSSGMSTAQKIAEIELEMEKTQKNKATSYHLGLLKAKLAKLKRELIEPAGGKKGGGGEGFEVSKSGDARVGMIGFPSVGKSTLLTKLTGKK